MSNNESIRENVKKVWKEYIQATTNYNFAPKNLYRMLFQPKNWSQYSYDSDLLLSCDNAEFLRLVWNDVLSNLDNETITQINKGSDGDIIISIVPSEFVRATNKPLVKGQPIHIVYNGLDDYIRSDELVDFLNNRELKYFPVILSHYGRLVNNMIPCVNIWSIGL